MCAPKGKHQTHSAKLYAVTQSYAVVKEQVATQPANEFAPREYIMSAFADQEAWPEPTSVCPEGHIAYLLAAVSTAGAKGAFYARPLTMRVIGRRGFSPGQFCVVAGTAGVLRKLHLARRQRSNLLVEDRRFELLTY
jgi:hypothetical protein